MTAERPRWLSPSEYPFESRSKEIDGNDVRYIDEGRGRTLLFVHAGPSWSFIYRRVIERLRTDFRCIAIDFPLSGASRAADTYRPTLRAASGILDAFVRALDLRGVTLVVHDLGGPVSLDVATRMPDRFVAIAATDSFAWPLAARHPRVRRMLRVVSSRPFSLLNDVANIIARVEGMPYGAGRGLSPEGRRVFLAPFRDRRVRRAALAMLGDAANDTAFLARVEADVQVALSDRPVLLVFGAESPTIHEHFPERWAELFTDTRLVIVQGAHHFPMVDAPDVVATAIAEWHRDRVTSSTIAPRLIPRSA
ncbi:MAG TPA: alpha/beta fold hydrolase [Candidatus Limnocylindria bacterium]